MGNTQPRSPIQNPQRRLMETSPQNTNGSYQNLNPQQTQQMTKQQKDKLIKDKQEELNDVKKYVNERITTEDRMHILCMKPIQCALDQFKEGLPTGLKIVHRISQNQYALRPIQKVDSNQKFIELKINRQSQFSSYQQYLIANNGDNMISQMKTHGQMELGICVCMYNQDKIMMKSTLNGVGQNITQLYHQGVDPDKIVVIIIQDGIEKMDSSVLQLVGELERQSSMNFQNKIAKNLSQYRDQFNKLNDNKKIYKWEGENNLVNITPFLFSPQELQQRQSIRFINVKKQYDQKKILLEQINKLRSKKRITHLDLPQYVYNFFIEECKHAILKLNPSYESIKDEKIKIQKINERIHQIENDIMLSIPLVQTALAKAKQTCEQYFLSRSEMSHVSFFRTTQFFSQQSILTDDELYFWKSQRCNLKSTNGTINEQKRKKILQIEKKLAVKMNIMFVVKYKNNQKLSSHNWFFNGFCKQFGDFTVKKASNPAQSFISNQENADQTNLQMQISPKYTVLLDVGLRPQSKSLVLMYNTMKNNPNIGGVCGYMGLKIQKTDPNDDKELQDLGFFTKLCLKFVDIQRAQQIQYHFAHIIDKAFQSCFKFIHVLPGAFSAYNMQAIWGTKQDMEQQNRNLSRSQGEHYLVGKVKQVEKLLKNYFKSISQKLKDQKYQKPKLNFFTIFFRIILPNFILRCFKWINYGSTNTYEGMMYEENVYLAEDRILCMGIHLNGKQLIFLPDAYSFVDPVKNLGALLGQRKRWINGSFFAFEKVSKDFAKQQGCFKPITIQIYYMAFMNIMAYVSPAMFLFSINVCMEVVKADILVYFLEGTLNENSGVYDAFVYTINFIYGMALIWLVYFSVNLTNKDKKFVKFVYTVSTMFGLISIIMLIILIVDLIRGFGVKQQYLIENQSKNFVSQIPGGRSTVDLVRYILLGVIGLYAIPLLVYTILFKSLRALFEILVGALSFAFYTPTYLIILNIYALCRMDDLSWGTKGLDAGAGKDKQVTQIWKCIKLIHVGKFLFSNILIAGLLIHYSSNYLFRFYLTFALMVLIALTMAFKVFFALIYYLIYKCCIKTSPQLQTSYKQPSLYKPFDRKQFDKKTPLEEQICEKIQQNIKGIYFREIHQLSKKDKRVERILTYLQQQQNRTRNGTISEDRMQMVQIIQPQTTSNGLLNFLSPLKQRQIRQPQTTSNGLLNFLTPLKQRQIIEQNTNDGKKKKLKMEESPHVSSNLRENVSPIRLTVPSDIPPSRRMNVVQETVQKIKGFF